MSETGPVESAASVGSRVDKILDAARETAAGIVAEAGRSAEDVRLSVEAYAERVRRDGEREANEIVSAAQAEAVRLRAEAREATEREAAALARSNRELREDGNALASRRDRLLRDLERIARDLEDAIDELAPDESPDTTISDALDVRRRP